MQPFKYPHVVSLLFNRALILYLFFMLFIAPLSAQMGRLLVNIEATASFTPEEFSSATSAKLLNIEPRNPYKALQDIFFDSPFVVISCFLEESLLGSLARQYGYRYVVFKQESLIEAIESTNILLQTIPKYSADIPYLSSEEAMSVYKLMEKLDRIFVANKLHYWAGGGTLLGAIRHGGLIPWDDDLDLYILEIDEKKLQGLKDEFAKEGLVLHHYWKDLYKIFEANSQVIPDQKHPGDILPFRNPAADIFLMTLEKTQESKDVYVHRSYDFYYHWNRDRFTYAQIRNITRVPFGPLNISIPKDPEAYLNHLYGLSWKTHAIEPTWNHQKEQSFSYSGAAMVEINDFSPSPWH